MTAEVKILVEGHTNADTKAESGGEERTCATISLVRDKDLIIVVDPGILESQQILVDALAKEGLDVKDVNMVCITHSHLDHYRNIGMFPDAKAIDYFGIWNKSVCEDWHEQFTPNIQILRTPGHDYTSITFFVRTDDGVVAICGDVFWRENSPKYDHNAKSEKEQEELKESRKLVLEMSDWIIPGHAKIYKTDKSKITELTKENIKRKTEEQKIFGFCRKCKRVMKSKLDSCRCRPHLCHCCCECGIDCDLCGCTHKI